MNESLYVKGLQLDADLMSRGQEKFLLSKSEQQKVLETLCLGRFDRNEKIRVADVACGNGHLSFHLAQLFPCASFTLIDLNELILDEARQFLGNETRFEFRQADIHNLPEEWVGKYDCVICWQTLSWLEDYRTPIVQMIKMLKTSGVFYASLLLNCFHDVDILAKVVDYTRPSFESGIFYVYNTYSRRQFETFLGQCGLLANINPFEIKIDLPEVPNGLGTYTLPIKGNGRLQLSGGLLMNWAIVEAMKE